MKYKLLKELPMIKVWEEVYIEQNSSETYAIHKSWMYGTYNMRISDLSEWLEEVKEPKTIYDLKKGDKYYEVYANLQINSNIYNWHSQVTSNMFLTEREAKWNKLLRKLSTRTDKWLPKEWEYYYTYRAGRWIESYLFENDESDIFNYHIGFIFRNKEEYNKYITEEAKDLLFKI